MKNIVCLGAGLVARPYIHYLSEHGFHVTVASRTVKKAEELTKGCSNTDAVKFDIQSDDKLLEKLTAESDLVCSLLPYTYHVRAAKVAIKHRKHFCTTSYISKEMSDLDSKARESGILLLNECGVDPGIDHMSAMRIIDEIHRTGGKILSFTSFTGGLPAPEANNNPFGYKLSWSPRGVLLAGRNDAHFLQDGKERVIPGPVLFDNYEILEVPAGGKFEAYPNRDSISYIEIYRIPEVRTMLRGTLRNLGWCSTMKKIAELGLLNLDEKDLTGMTYADLLRQTTVSGTSDLARSVARRIGVEADSHFIQRLNWLGLFSEQRIPEETRTYLDALCHLFEQKMQYAPGERDMLVMHHEFIAQYSNRNEKTISTLIDYGIPHGDSSMSRTVSLPVAIASRLILEGKIGLTGVYRPTVPELYNPILDELKGFDIAMNEKTTRL
jgi:saccharopine dehydrogenase-like NADP-dependent oxidoreductase